MKICPYCKSCETRLLVRINQNTVEYICEDCGCTFNVDEPQK